MKAPKRRRAASRRRRRVGGHFGLGRPVLGRWALRPGWYILRSVARLQAESAAPSPDDGRPRGRCAVRSSPGAVGLESSLARSCSVCSRRRLCDVALACPGWISGSGTLSTAHRPLVHFQLPTGGTFWVPAEAQSESFLKDQIARLQVMLKEFLEQVPSGGTKDKTTRSRIAEIKRELRSLAKWDRLFYAYKVISFPAEIEHIFVLASHEPVAAIWHYSDLDAQGEYQKTYNHQQRDGRVYAVRDSWAIEKSLMKVGQAGYLDEISRPGQEIGCMCSLEWVTSLPNVPAEMLTAKARTR